MAQKIAVAMPQDVDVGATWTLRVAAVDQTTGNAVASVKISNMTLEVTALTNVPLDSGVFKPVLLRQQAT